MGPLFVPLHMADRRVSGGTSGFFLSILKDPESSHCVGSWCRKGGAFPLASTEAVTAFCCGCLISSVGEFRSPPTFVGVFCRHFVPYRS